MNTYTVVGTTPHQDCVDHVKALTPTHAGWRWRKEMAKELDCDEDDIAVIAVFCGKLTDNYDLSLDTPEYMEELDREAAGKQARQG